MYWNRHFVRKRTAGRPSLTSQEFGQRYYPDNSELAATVRDVLQKHIGIDLSKLEPSDQPVKNFYLGAFDGYATEDVIVDIEKAFGIQIKNEDAEKMRSVDDIIRYVISKVQEKESAI